MNDNHGERLAALEAKLEGMDRLMRSHMEGMEALIRSNLRGYIDGRLDSLNEDIRSHYEDTLKELDDVNTVLNGKDGRNGVRSALKDLQADNRVQGWIIKVQWGMLAIMAGEMLGWKIPGLS